MSRIDLLPELSDRLDRLVPAEERLVADWEDILRRVVPPSAPAPRRRHRRLQLVLVAVVLFLLFVGIATGTYFALRGSGDSAHGLTIVFDESAGPNSSAAIAAVEPNGHLKVLWTCPRPNQFCGHPTSIAWSADGKKLAFTMDEIGGRSGYVGLHIVDAVSGRDLQLPRMGRRDTSPQQSRSFFEKYWRRGTRQLGCPWPTGVAWSHDGSKLAYSCAWPSRRPKRRIFVIRADGSGRTALPTRTSGALLPSWSPDGKWIAFATHLGSGSNFSSRSRIYVVGLDGSHRRLVARVGTAPAWSPDGRTIAYRARCGLRLVTPRGRDVTPPALAAGCREIRRPGFPAWSPDGSRLAIASWSGVYVLDADGTDLSRVTEVSGTGVMGSGRPAWTPTPRVVLAPQLPPRRSRCC
jgi:Tol biopolymer transport system component